MRIILIHGYKGSPQSNFFPWLHDRLKDLGHEVIAPALPNPAEPDPEAWTKTLLEEVGPLNDETVIFGHSLGGAATLLFLEAAEARSTPKGVVLSSAPWHIRHERFSGFFTSELEYDVLPWKAHEFVVVHAQDDDVVPFDHGQKYAKLLKAKLIAPETGGHFDDPEQPVILEAIKAVIDSPVVYEPGMSLDDDYQDLIER